MRKHSGTPKDWFIIIIIILYSQDQCSNKPKTFIFEMNLIRIKRAAAQHIIYNISTEGQWLRHNNQHNAQVALHGKGNVWTEKKGCVNVEEVSAPSRREEERFHWWRSLHWTAFVPHQDLQALMRGLHVRLVNHCALNVFTYCRTITHTQHTFLLPATVCRINTFQFNFICIAQIDK